MLYYLSFLIRAMHVWVDTYSKVPWRSIESDHVLPHRLQDLPGVGSRNLNQKWNRKHYFNYFKSLV